MAPRSAEVPATGDDTPHDDITPPGGLPRAGLGTGPGGLGEIGLSVTFKGITYGLKVNPPAAEGNGWSFAVTDKDTEKPHQQETTLASFQLVNGQSWSAVANAPRMKHAFNTPINLRQAALNVGMGPVATFSPTEIPVGQKIKLTVRDVADHVATVNVTLKSNGSDKRSFVLAPVPLTDGQCNEVEVELTSNSSPVPAGEYSVQVTERITDGGTTKDGLTIPAGTPTAPYHALTIKTA